MNQQAIIEALGRRIQGTPVESDVSGLPVIRVGIVPMRGLPCPYVVLGEDEKRIFCPFDPLRKREGK